MRAAGSGWRGGASGCLGRRPHGVCGEREGEKPMNTLTGRGEGGVFQGWKIKLSSFVKAHRSRGPGAGYGWSGVCHVKYAGCDGLRERSDAQRADPSAKRAREWGRTGEALPWGSSRSGGGGGHRDRVQVPRPVYRGKGA